MIKIAVVAYNNEEPALPMSAVFGHEGGTLGRSEDNYFVLPDSRHYVSRLQASIKSDGARHTIANLSKANPILINGQEIDSNQEYDLREGDEIQIGLYLLRAESMSSAGHAAQGSVASNDATNGLPAPQRHLASNQKHSALPVAPAPSESVHPPSVAETKAEQETPLNIEPAAQSDSEGGQRSSSENMDEMALMQAFLQGAGIPSNTITTGLTPELMDMLGKLLAATVQGAIELNASRAVVKREVNADMTMVVVRNNNPLKFFPDSQTVLTQMLRKKMPGFMGPVEAMEDVLEDLRTHQIAVVAGTRATLSEQLKRFNPAHVEKKLKDGSFLDSILPASRKAKLWDLYNKTYNAIYQESQDDAHALYGKAFLTAYESEIERLRGGVQDA